MIRQIAVAVLAAGALAACVPYGDGMMSPYATGANPLTQAFSQMATPSYGYGQPGYGQPAYGYGQPGYGNPYYGAAPAPVYAPRPVYMPQQAAAPVYAPTGYPYSYSGGRPNWQGRPHHAAADRNNNGVPDWKERDRNGDGVPDYQQRTRRFTR